jgi:hypothetical protein
MDKRTDQESGVTYLDNELQIPIIASFRSDKFEYSLYISPSPSPKSSAGDSPSQYAIGRGDQGKGKR